MKKIKYFINICVYAFGCVSLTIVFLSLVKFTFIFYDIVSLFVAAIVAILLGVKQAKKQTNQDIYIVLMDLFDIYKKNNNRFAAIEEKIKKEHDEKGWSDLDQNRLAYIIKATIEADGSFREALAVLSVLITILISDIFHILLWMYIALFICIALLFFGILYYLPREKYIVCVCDKIIEESHR